MTKQTTISLSLEDARACERVIAIFTAIKEARRCASGGYITLEDIKFLAEVGKGHDPVEKVDMREINFMGYSMDGITLTTERGDK